MANRILNYKTCPFRHHHEIWDGKCEIWWISCDYYGEQDCEFSSYSCGNKCKVEYYEDSCPLTDEDFEKLRIEYEDIKE